MLVIFLSSTRYFQSQGVKYEIFPKLEIDRTNNDKSKFSRMIILSNLNDFLSIFYCICSFLPQPACYLCLFLHKRALSMTPFP